MWEAAVVSWASAWARLGIKPRTGARYAQSLVCVRPWLDGKKVHEIDNALLKEIVSARAKHGITNATIRRDMTAISSVLGHCVDEGWIEENPAHMMDRSRFKERKAKIILPRPTASPRCSPSAAASSTWPSSPRDRDAAGRDRRASSMTASTASA
jgi:integrase/recombinase XerD